MEKTHPAHPISQFGCFASSITIDMKHSKVTGTSLHVKLLLSSKLQQLVLLGIREHVLTHAPRMHQLYLLCKCLGFRVSKKLHGPPRRWAMSQHVDPLGWGRMRDADKLPAECHLLVGIHTQTGREEKFKQSELKLTFTENEPT